MPRLSGGRIKGEISPMADAYRAGTAPRSGAADGGPAGGWRFLAVFDADFRVAAFPREAILTAGAIAGGPGGQSVARRAGERKSPGCTLTGLSRHPDGRAASCGAARAFDEVEDVNLLNETIPPARHRIANAAALLASHKTVFTPRFADIGRRT